MSDLRFSTWKSHIVTPGGGGTAAASRTCPNGKLAAFAGANGGETIFQTIACRGVRYLSGHPDGTREAGTNSLLMSPSGVRNASLCC
jgi:hypothetical protein